MPRGYTANYIVDYFESVLWVDDEGVTWVDDEGVTKAETGAKHIDNGCWEIKKESRWVFATSCFGGSLMYLKPDTSIFYDLTQLTDISKWVTIE